MRTRVSALQSVDDIEKELDTALRDLRALNGTNNTQAVASIEYRIGRLRQRKEQLER